MAVAWKIVRPIVEMFRELFSSTFGWYLGPPLLAVFAHFLKRLFS